VPVSAYRRSETLRALWPWLPLWALVALLAIFSHGPMPLYSTRTLAVAWEMWSHGHWLVPYINGEPYSEKAPLLFWLIHAGWFVFGVSDVWPRVLEVLIGGIQLVLISVMARRLFPNRPWIAKGAPWMLLALSYAFLFGQQIMYDVLLAVWALAALLCLTPRLDRAEPRWLIFGLCIGAGLLTKGPVMMLHVLLPWLLGPLWSDWAREHRARWYGRGLLAVLLGVAMLIAWALPAGFAGGDVYRQRLFFTQTAGRVVKGMQHAEPLQSHAHPSWWYLLYLPVLLFPFSAWPRVSVALVVGLFHRPWRDGMRLGLGLMAIAVLGYLSLWLCHWHSAMLEHLLICLLLVPLFVALLRQPLEPGMHFLLCWLLPTFLVFSLISGKQAYYPLPEFGGAVVLIAAAIAQLRERQPRLADNAWLGTWPLGVGGIIFAVFLFALPALVNGNHLHGEWFDDTASYSRSFGVVFLLLGALLLVRGRGEMRRLAVASLVATLALNSLFTLSLWPKYDLKPSARLLGEADRAQRAIGYVGNYDGQFHFEGRLQHPIIELFGDQAVREFAQEHPDGLIVDHPGKLESTDLRYALLVQPFRSSWMVIWQASSLADIDAGQTPQEPVQPTRIYPVVGGGHRVQP
jgi:4-amino-4-deoxy-L-arabinose transferase-like glycosyltransferase